MQLFLKVQYVIYILISISLIARVKPDCGAITQQYDIADGYSVSLVANNLTDPRGIAFDSQGALLVVQQMQGIVKLYNGCNNYTQIIEQKDLTHGIWLQGDKLYASSEANVYSWDYPTLSNKQTIVTGMVNPDHVSRTLLIRQDLPNILIIARGSGSNVDLSAWNKTAGTAQIRTFDLKRVPKGGYDWVDGGLIAWGVRNEVGIATDWQGNLWGVENSADQLIRDGEDIHLDQPGEEMNFFGDPSRPMSKFYGYPGCFSVWQDQFSLQTGQQFALNPNRTFDDQTCLTTAIAPNLTFQPHTAPLDIKFAYGPTSMQGLADDGSAWVTMHGSWNSEPPTGYKLVQVGMENITSSDGSKAVRPSQNSTSQNGYKDIFWNKDLGACPRACFRPVGLAFDTMGRLWMSSDATGQIFMFSNSTTGSTPSASSGTSGAAPAPSKGFKQVSKSSITVIFLVVSIALYLLR